MDIHKEKHIRGRDRQTERKADLRDRQKESRFKGHMDRHKERH